MAYNANMQNMPLDHIQAREAFHVLLLRRLVDSLPHGTWRLKGGVNLRLFFGSLRYSEDMDLDADLRVGDALKREIRKAITDPALRVRLVALGICEVRQEGRAVSKDTDTTLRLKMQLLVQGGVLLPTKVETSFRPRFASDFVVEQPADSAIVGRYLDAASLPLVVPHYPLTPAVRQKLTALAHRSQVQALDLPQEAYVDKVLAFLDEEHRTRWMDRWDEQRVFVADLADALLALPGDERPA
mgnify:FL=1